MTTVHQSLYPWLYGNQFNSFGDLIESFHGKGIVISTGDYHFKYAISTINTLRHVLNCTLPIEVFYSDENDLSSENQQLLAEFDNVYVSDLSNYSNNEIIDVNGWATKPFAILASRFEEVILMDADVLYLRDPSELFKEKGYIEKGTLFFRDRTLYPGSHKGSKWLKEWMINPLPETEASRFWNEQSIHEMESSTVVIHKIKTILGLLNVCKLNELNYRQGVIYKMVYGDKETFWMGFDMARQPYYMSPIPCLFVGELVFQNNDSSSILCGHNGHSLEDGQLLY